MRASPPPQVADGKRSRSSPTREEELKPSCLSLATALPLSVWQDHLAPFLRRSEAARLRGVCKALRGVVHECPVDVGVVRARDLRLALTCCPAAQSVNVAPNPRQPLLEPTEESELVELLRQHGGTLTRVTAEWEGAERVLSSAVRAGALPNLNSFTLRLSDPEQLELLSDGRFRLMEEMHLVMSGLRGREEPLAALEHLRHLPHLRSLSLIGPWKPWGGEVAVPAFIPPSLKTLRVSSCESLMRDLPFILQTCGASLEMIELESPYQLSAEGGAAFARVLHTCSSTLKVVHFAKTPYTGRDFRPACRSELALGLVSCCDGLERLVVPWGVFSRLPPTCPTFTRLTHLCVDGEDGPVDLTSPVWELVAGGLLPALAELRLEGHQGLSWGRGGAGAEGGCRLARALEGVAGTLRRLTIRHYRDRRDPPIETCYEVGLALGKLRRLKSLSLSLFEDGRA
jgi:hypothetical protein